ncbi:MAG: aspartate dehydrogenase [Burkholderiales bacterium]
MRIGLLGAGTIARLILDHLGRGDLPGVEVVGVAGRSRTSRGADMAREHALPFVIDRPSLLALRPEVVLEAASHDAVREHLVPMLKSGVSVIVLSAGALADDELLTAAQAAAEQGAARLYVPSGGIGGLDALKAACVAGVDDVSIRVAKPPRAWSGIPYVRASGVDLDRLTAAHTLFSGSAREGVPHFPQNVNIAAVLSMAGIGLSRTRLEVVADPKLTHNTHTIRVSGKSGRFTVVLENVPAPDNPKTAWLACYSALAALREMASRTRFGT